MEVIEKPGTTRVRASINEKKFFERMGHLFASSFSVLGELMQNARRAGATRIDFTIDAEKKTLSIQDDGHGIDDFATLICLCDSAWSESVVLEDRPFGMGLFSAFYSGESIDFLSNGKKLSMSLNDVISKRLLEVTQDQEAPAKGSIVRINGLIDKFLQTDTSYGSLKAEKVLTAASQIERFSRGFPVPVFVNGIEMARLHAVDQMAFAITEIGSVSIDGIHRGSGELDNVKSSPLLYLQGLPIGVSGKGYDAHPIVHLDSVRFVAKMPDRADLFDAYEQGKVIRQSLLNTTKQFLIEQKAKLSQQEMVRLHWADCMAVGMLHLFNDIPLVPASIFENIAHVEVSGFGESVFVTQTEAEGVGLISRQDLIGGKLVAWRDTPSSSDEDPWAIVCLKVMQSQGIYALQAPIDPAHWLNELLPSFGDFVFSVTATDVSEQFESFGHCCSNVAVEVRLCEAIVVNVSSKTDPAFVRSYKVANDWIMVPIVETIWDEVYEAFVSRTDKSEDQPVRALSNYLGEHDQYHEEWEADDIDRWHQLVNNLSGAHLAATVRNAFPCGVSFSEGHLSQVAVCTVLPDDDYSTRRLKVREVDDSTFEALALSIGGVTANQIRLAFDAVFTPGAPEPLKTQG